MVDSSIKSEFVTDKMMMDEFLEKKETMDNEE